jgi:hypothetical protein
LFWHPTPPLQGSRSSPAPLFVANGKPIVLPVGTVAGSISFRVQIRPDGKIEMLPPKLAEVIPIDRTPRHVSRDRRKDIIKRAVQALSPETVRLLRSGVLASKQSRQPTVEEGTAVDSFRAAVTRECESAGLSVEELLKINGRI